MANITGIDLFIIIASLTASFFLYLLSRRYNTRHRRKIRQAERVLSVIRSFEGKYVDQRIFTYLRKVDPFVFEELILTCFEQSGYKIIRNKKYTGDGGIDGRVIINDELHLIQCKRYKNHITRKDVEEFDAKVAQHRAKKGFFVHTGKTGKASKECFYPKVKMISGYKLLTLIQGKY